jgi:hypothetical protein
MGYKSFIFELYAAELGHTRKVWNFEKRRTNNHNRSPVEDIVWCPSFSMCYNADCSASAKGFPSFANPENRSVLQEMLYH